MKKYKNIILTKDLNEAKFITHSGKFHVDDVMATVFLSKINDEIILARIPSTNGLIKFGNLHCERNEIIV